jgi:phage terminase large subunit-like protein
VRVKYLPFAEQVRALSEPEKDAFFDSLSPEELHNFKFDFFGIHARQEQLYPEGSDWMYWILSSGRGFGKTRVGSETTHKWAKEVPGCHIALVGQAVSDVRDVMVELGDSSILKTASPNFYPDYQPSKRRLVWPNGSVASLYSGDKPDQLRGPQHHFAWIDELCKLLFAKECWANLSFGLRLGDPKAIITTTPRPMKLFKDLLNNPRSVVRYGSTFDNAANLSPEFIETIREAYEGTRLGDQELYGKYLDDVPGALWTKTVIAETRKQFTNLPDMVKIAVAIDPAAGVSEDSAETGIILGGKGTDGHFYVWADLSGRWMPQEWAHKAIKAYFSADADAIVIEINHGGEMCKQTLRSVNDEVRIVSVSASRGKLTRAEPVAALWEQGRGHIVGYMDDLEDQLCNYAPDLVSDDTLKDRMDAMVWLAHELMIKPRDFRIL